MGKGVVGVVVEVVDVGKSESRDYGMDVAVSE